MTTTEQRQIQRLERRLSDANEEAFHARADLRAARASQDRAEKRVAELEAQAAQLWARANQTEHVMGILRRIVRAYLAGGADREIASAHQWMHRTGEMP